MAVIVSMWLIVLSMTTNAHAAPLSDLSSEWGGHVRAIGTISSPDDRSIYQFTDTETFLDSQAEVRLNHQLFSGTRWSLETHYELVGRKGDTLKNNNRLRQILSPAAVEQLAGMDLVSDDRKLMNLTRTLREENDHIAYHRLDRLNLTYSWDGGALRVGRQALTWGNGLLFNPMDIFNPFSPTAVQRDYKAGEDMAHVQISRGDMDGQLLYVPRRNIESGRVSTDQSSVAAKWHLPAGAMAFDLMAARHYDDVIWGAGASGNLGGATWRADITYTRLDDHTRRRGFWQAVLNLDYAWQWGGRNVYGQIEWYHNGLGEKDDYSRALSDPDLSDRLGRGEQFTLGRDYLAGRLQIELHPLLQTGVTAIVNTGDPSAILQPQLMWDVAPNLQLILGADLNWGDDGTEFGGFDIATDVGTIKVFPPDSRYLWLTYFF